MLIDATAHNKIDVTTGKMILMKEWTVIQSKAEYETVMDRIA